VAADSSQDRPGTTDPGAVARELTERFQELMNRLSKAGLAGMPNLLNQWMAVMEAGGRLASLPVRQTTALVQTIRTQRDQVRALQAQLDVFEKQLKALEDSLRPLVEWGQQWTRVQESMLSHMRGLTRDATKQDR
jgi:hypothetical protein